MNVYPKTCRVLLQMIRDRGYIMDQYELDYASGAIDFWEFMRQASGIEEGYVYPTEQPLADLVTQIRSLMPKIYVHQSRPANPDYRSGEAWTLQLAMAEALDGHRDTLLSYLPGLKREDEVDEILIVVEKPVNYNAREHLSESIVDIQIFNVEQLCNNPTTHVNQVEHRLLSRKERARVLAQLRNTISEMPLMSRSSPMAMYWNWPPGSLIAIKRSDENSLAHEIQYRVVAR